MERGTRYVNIHTGWTAIYLRTEYVKDSPADIRVHVLEKEQDPDSPLGSSEIRLNGDSFYLHWRIDSSKELTKEERSRRKVKMDFTLNDGE